MTINIKATLACDVGLKCTKQIVRSIEGPRAAERVRAWGNARGWRAWGDRDACPECWKELHGYRPGEVSDNHPTGGEEELQRAIEARRKQLFD